MSLETELLTFEDWTLRARPPMAQGRRVLLMLHGWQGDENSMWIFAQNLARDIWILAPRAPHIAPEGGYTWRTPVRGGWPSVDTLRPSVEALIGLLDGWGRANRMDTTRVDVVGFSQGAAMTFAFGLLYPQRVGRMGVLAGFAPEGSEAVLTAGMLEGRQVFVAHGTRDVTVPVEQAQRSIRLLEKAGARVSYCQSDVGHKLSLDCLKALEAFLSV